MPQKTPAEGGTNLDLHRDWAASEMWQEFPERAFHGGVTPAEFYRVQVPLRRRCRSRTKQTQDELQNQRQETGKQRIDQ